MKQKFCPKCKSDNVKPTTNYMDLVFGWRYWMCNECGFKLVDFPERELKIARKIKSSIKRHKK